jgi:hypothetical protein
MSFGAAPDAAQMVRGGRCREIDYSGNQELFACTQRNLLSPARAVWIFEGSSQSEQEELVDDLVTSIYSTEKVAGDSAQDSSCRYMWQRLLCDSALPPCADFGFAPRQLCPEVCAALTRACGPTFERVRAAGQGSFVPDCGAAVGSAAASAAGLYLRYPHEWSIDPVFYGPAQTWPTWRPDGSPGPPSDAACFGAKEYQSLLYEPAAWNDMNVCQHFGGQWTQAADLLTGQQVARCVLPGSGACLAAGGKWMFLAAQSRFDCFFAGQGQGGGFGGDGSGVGGSGSGGSGSGSGSGPAPAWPLPQADASAGVPVTHAVDGSVRFRLPLNVKFKCDAKARAEGLQVVISVALDCEQACKPPPPDLVSVNAGLARLLPCEFVLPVTQTGHHAVSFAGVGPGRRDSDSVTWEFATTAEAADGPLELPTDDNTVFLRSGISFPVPDPDSLDPSLFALAVLTVLNKMLGLALTPDNVFVREVTSTGVLFEVRVPRDQKDRVAEMCRNPLFLYPLAVQLYDVGVINATDSCAAVTQMSINSSAWQALVAPQPAGLSTGATVALAVLLPLLVLAQCVAFKRLRLRDHVLTARASVLEKQERDLVKREQELQRRLAEIEAQQQAALSEKAALVKDAQGLEAEASQAAAEVDAVVRQELVRLAPEQDHALESLEKVHVEAIAAQGLTQLREIQKVFAAAPPPPDVQSSVARIEQALTSGDFSEFDDSPMLMGLFSTSTPRGGRGAPGSGSGSGSSGSSGRAGVAARGEGQQQGQQALAAFLPSLQRFAGEIHDAKERAAFQALLARMQAGAAGAAEEAEATRQSYEESLLRLRQDMHTKREELKAKLAAHRKERLELVIADAKREPGSPAAPSVGSAPAQSGAAGPGAEAAGEAGSNPAAALAKAIDEQEEEQFRLTAEAMRRLAPSQHEFEKAMRELNSNKEESRQRQLQALERRRVEVRKQVESQQADLERQREAAEARQRLVAAKVAGVFRKISNAETRVNKLKEDHLAAQLQLDQSKEAERQRLRHKLEDKKKAKASAKVVPREE